MVLTVDHSSSASAFALGAPKNGIREILELGRTMGDVIQLSLGEPSFPTPPHVIEAAERALEDGWTKYASSAGVPALREALAQKVHRVNGITADPDQIMVTAGAVEGLLLTLFTLCEQGDEVLLPNPGWSNYLGMAHLARVKPVGYSLNAQTGYVPNLAQLEELVTPRTRVLVLNSPSNPIGSLIREPLMRELLDFADRRGIWVVADECYDELTYEEGFVSAAALSDSPRIVTAHSFSKTYAMTGWRVGYLTLPKGLTQVVTRINEPVVSCVSTVGQAAALAAVSGPQDCVREMRSGYKSRRDLAVATLIASGVSPALVPPGAFYLWVDAREHVTSSHEFALQLLRERRVAVTPGTAFGDEGEGYFRISYGGDIAELETGLRSFSAQLTGITA
ncbi:aminotransferase class I/II-fold pyridoxal phosphate-dependent enzyme [Microbacterium sp. KR10-403]|uniref:pyridoxal phosphate-dependent aminotransferase n=1 Tax=Microbacterium sp. KR10-403 TaxID=3158581 RepID=UPI0032E4A17D